MEYLIFWLMALGFIAAVIGVEIYRDRKKQKRFKESLHRDYGILHERRQDLERFARINRYYLKHVQTGQIDDVTWNDLDMDQIFRSMNHTYSAAGEEYLYHTLRSAGQSAEQLEGLEKWIRYFMEHEEERVYVQLQMAKLGYLGKYSLYDYIDNLGYLGERSNRRAILMDLLFIPLVACMPFFFSYALLGCIALMVFNIMTYFKEKEEIEPYIISFQFIVKLLDAADRVEKVPSGNKDAFWEPILNEIKEKRSVLAPLRRGSIWVASKNGSLSGNPLDLLMDYLKMTFHVDLIVFNKMLAFLQKNVQPVDDLNTLLGRLETSIAIGAWRTSLGRGNGYCVPKFLPEGEIALRVEEGYHPLIDEPVKNTIETKQGVLLTGSNASGKSTFLKMVAINAILAQTVHTCTASRYEAHIWRIYSSMSLRDDIESGDSYYMVEIKALKRILTAVKEEGMPVLCFVDEVLRGTNIVERIAASTQILHSLYGKSVLCFAATHDVELTELLKEEYHNYHFEEEIIDGDVCFQYRLLPGKATTRNAIKLLEIIGYDEDVIQKAQERAERFVQTGLWS